MCACALAVLAPGAGSAQEGACSVEAFQGAASPQGAVARMRVANTSTGCAVTTFGIPGNPSTAAESGRITKHPVHGRAQFVAPRATYTPAPNYVGADSFEFEAIARGRGDQQLRLKVRVEVQVVAP